VAQKKRRFILLRLTESFYGREDHGLTDKLLLELPSILNWAIDGLMRLRERGYFLQPASAADALQQMEDLASPIGAFLRERCVIGPNQWVEISHLFDVWCVWCRTQGRDHPGSVQSFGQALHSVIPSVVVRKMGARGNQIRVYDGVKLNPSSP
jgi:putative DNA primase/helicase